MKLQTIFWRWWYRLRSTPSKYTRLEALAIARKYHLEGVCDDSHATRLQPRRSTPGVGYLSVC